MLSARRRRLLAANASDYDQSIEYPEMRAHVYFASPEQCFKKALDAIASSTGFRTVSADESNLCLVAEARISGADPSHPIVIEALPLGPRHTRLVIRSPSPPKRLGRSEKLATIQAIQAVMDQKLIGG